MSIQEIAPIKSITHFLTPLPPMIMCGFDSVLNFSMASFMSEKFRKASCSPFLGQIVMLGKDATKLNSVSSKVVGSVTKTRCKDNAKL